MIINVLVFYYLEDYKTLFLPSWLLKHSTFKIDLIFHISFLELYNKISFSELDQILSPSIKVDTALKYGIQVILTINIDIASLSILSFYWLSQNRKTIFVKLSLLSSILLLQLQILIINVYIILTLQANNQNVARICLSRKVIITMEY